MLFSFQVSRHLCSICLIHICEKLPEHLNRTGGRKANLPFISDVEPDLDAGRIRSFCLIRIGINANPDMDSDIWIGTVPYQTINMKIRIRIGIIMMPIHKTAF
jgi:hypothetical protein